MNNITSKLLSALAWFFGILFALTGFVAIFKEGILVGLIMLIGGVLLLPPVKRFLISKQPKLSNLMLSIAGVILIIGSTFGFSHVESDEVIDNDSQVTTESKLKNENLKESEDSERKSTENSAINNEVPLEAIEEDTAKIKEEEVEPKENVVDNTSKDSDKESDTKIREKACVDLSKTAEAIMSARQSGRSISEVMKIAELSGNPMAEMLVKAFIKDAYNVPLQSSEQLKKVTITEFGNQAYLECAKVFIK